MEQVRLLAPIATYDIIRREVSTFMDKWIVLAFVACFLAGLAAAGWHFHQLVPWHSKVCSAAAAHCGEKRI